MGTSCGTIDLSAIDEEKMQELFDFLAYGKIPEGLHMKRPPKLGEQMAFRIIYFLQEETGVLPDKWEMCKTCKCLYNSENEGCSKQRHCDDCRRYK